MSQDSDTIITLHVNTNSINISNYKDHVTFSDNQGDHESGHHAAEFSSVVYAGKNVIWKAFDQSGNIINVSCVAKKIHNGGSDILTSDPTKRPGHPNQCMGVVKSDYVSGDESYNVSFEVHGHTYIIDPKLRMHTGD